MTRGRYMKTIAEFIRHGAPDMAANVEPLLPIEDQHLIETTSALGWLPAEINFNYTCAIYEGLGDTAADRFFHDLVLRNIRTPMLEGFTTSFVRLMGLDPGALARGVGNVTTMLFKDAGTWSLATRDEHSAEVHAEGLPDMFTVDPWPRSAQSSIGAILTIAGKDGTCVRADEGETPGTLVFRLEWE